LDSDIDIVPYSDMNLAALHCETSAHTIAAIHSAHRPSPSLGPGEATSKSHRPQIEVVHTNYNPELHEPASFSGFTDEERYDFTEREREKAGDVLPFSDLENFKGKASVRQECRIVR
jgi:hypothetical protein